MENHISFNFTWILNVDMIWICIHTHYFFTQSIRIIS